MQHVDHPRDIDRTKDAEQCMVQAASCRYARRLARARSLQSAPPVWWRKARWRNAAWPRNSHLRQHDDQRPTGRPQTAYRRTPARGDRHGQRRRSPGTGSRSPTCRARSETESALPHGALRFPGNNPAQARQPRARRAAALNLNATGGRSPIRERSVSGPTGINALTSGSGTVTVTTAAL